MPQPDPTQFGAVPVDPAQFGAVKAPSQGLLATLKEFASKAWEAGAENRKNPLARLGNPHEAIGLVGAGPAVAATKQARTAVTPFLRHILTGERPATQHAARAVERPAPVVAEGLGAGKSLGGYAGPERRAVPRPPKVDQLEDVMSRLGFKAHPPEPMRITPTTSKGPMSTLPGAEGMTVADIERLEALSPTPGVRVLSPKPASFPSILAERAKAHAGHVAEGELDRAARGTSKVLSKVPKGEKGAISSELIKAVPGVLNQLRVASMLSGAAIPKNIIGGLSAGAVSSLERGSVKPIVEMLRAPTNLRTAIKAFRTGADPATISTAGTFSGAGKLNLPGRVIGAIDKAAIQALERAGTPAKDISRLMLNEEGLVPQWMQSGAPKFLFPFQKVPFNVLKQGLTANVATPRQAAVTAGMAGGGAVAGHQIDKSNLTPRQKTLAYGLLAAASGPRAVPTMAAAALGGGGARAMSGLSPIPEWALPTTLPKAAGVLGAQKPSAVRLYETLKEHGGRRQRPQRPQRPRR